MKNYILDNVEIITESGCWIWMLYCAKKGYGSASLPSVKNVIGAHRVSYFIFKGDIPDGMYVLHRCDVPSCCNPSHLWLGSNKDNMQDKCSKGRHRNRYTGKLINSTI